MKKIFFVAIAILLLIPRLSSQDTIKKTKFRTIDAQKSIHKVVLDGKIEEKEWSDATILDKFTQLRPTPFLPEGEKSKSMCFLKYDNHGIYFGGKLFEAHKDSISKELVGRDGFGNNDFVGIIFDTYKDNLNAFEYFVTPLNEQMDAKMAPNSNGDEEDFSWNAVWESKTHIESWGWSFEMFIPYAAIRFSPKDVQQWGLNVVRRRRKVGEQLFWNSIDPNVNGFLTQEGYWTNIRDIKPPIRLQLSPYVSLYSNHFPANIEGVSNTSTRINGGMDLKWGINQAFTLDATLIPDFGQVQSDPRVLNLTPFEVQFNEFRPFFTEGTDLFAKGGLFYSRRIGGTPHRFYDTEDELKAHEKLVTNPSEAKLINATKLSGRTHNGLGIGILNAITNHTFATIQDTLTGQTRLFETSPLTNFNVFVANKSLKNNSSFSFVNTNVWRSGSTYDANVTAFLLDLNNKANTINIGGQIKTSLLYGEELAKNKSGYSHLIYGGKSSGVFRFNVFNEVADAQYTSNDFGYFTNNNYINQGFNINIRQNKPNHWRNVFGVSVNSLVSYLFSPIGIGNPSYQQANLRYESYMQTKSLHWMGIYGDIRPYRHDYYEPRVEGSYFRQGGSFLIGSWFESNQAKKFYYVIDVAFRRYYDFYDSYAVDVYFSPNWRASDKFSVGLQLSWQPRHNNIGYSTSIDDLPIFANRNIQTFVNTVRAKYNFTNRMGLNAVVRHYSRSINNHKMYDLNVNGRLIENELNASEYNKSVNFFNVDLVYTWQIALGSFVNIVWKNSIAREDANYSSDYFSHLSNTLKNDQNNNLSIKVIYFLDYNTLKNKI